ncbi:MAG: DNA-directed DNA polymerase [Candidatus Korarchaeota archaeon]
MLFWLLDITEDMQTRDILLWGISGDGKRVVLREKKFRPSFYALCKNSTLPAVLPSDITLFREKRRLRGELVDGMKIIVNNPSQLKEQAKIFEKKGCTVYEHDIRYTNQFLIREKFPPASWVEVECSKEDGENNLPYETYILKSHSLASEEIPPPPLRILAIDIECFNALGTPKPDRDPIIIATLATEDDIKIFAADKDTNDDATLLHNLVEYISKKDPDVIVGYNTTFFDWPYILKRSSVKKINLGIGRDKSVPHVSLFGSISIPGRAHVDLYDVVRYVYDLKIKSLDYAAEYFGVVSRKKRTLVDYVDIPRLWTMQDEKLFQYAKDDATSTYALANILIPTVIEMSRITHLPLDLSVRASMGQRVEYYLMSIAASSGEVILPSRTAEDVESFTGALVLEPAMGIHENVAVLDFKSMYPSIMISHNISPDTLVGEDVSHNIEIEEAPDVRHKFRKDREGFFVSALRNLIEKRDVVRKLLSKHSPDSPEGRLLNTRQQVLKTIANAIYGYTGWLPARWYSKEVAESVTAWGRWIISNAVQMARQLGLKVFYGDTDSLFVSNDAEKIDRLLQQLQEKFNLEIKIEKIYRRIFFTTAKKRYCGVLENGEIDVVGFETVRGDWTELAKNLQDTVIKFVLEDGTPDRAVKYVKEVIQELKDGKIPLEQLVIWKTLTMPPSKYKVKTPHLEAARKLIEAGGRLEAGDMVGFIVAAGTGPLWSRVVPVQLVEKTSAKPDIEYYVTKQVIPTALRVLEQLGITERDLL